MDYAEYQLLADIDDELTALAENIARLQLIVEEMRSHALTGTRAVDQRCRAMTLEGHQCSNRATGRGGLQRLLRETPAASKRRVGSVPSIGVKARRPRCR